MERSLLVAVPGLMDKHRAQIAAAAEKGGLRVSFYEDDRAALPEAAEAEIIFAQSPLLARHAPKLRWLCTPSAGVNQFFGEGIFASPEAVLSNSSGAYGVTIAEHIVMVTLELLRRQIEYNQIVSRRDWTRDLPVRSIKNSRIVLLGTGDIGQEAAKRLRAFEPASILGVNRSGRKPTESFDAVRKQEELDSILPETDILVISLPGTPETFHMLDAARLARLPEGALIVNVGRGTVIDQEALEAELRAGRLCAALDVFEAEPVPADNSIWDCPNLLITPHTAGNMTLPYTKDRIVDLFVEDLQHYLAGQPLVRQVDLRKGY